MSGRALPIRLSAWLLLALLAFAATFAAVLLGWVAPRTESTFREHGVRLVEESSRAARAIAAQQTRAAGEVLVDVIAHGTRTRRRVLDDLPLELFGGDVGAIRAAIAAEDDRRSALRQRNVEVLGREMQARAERQISARFDALSATQTHLLAEVAGELRTTHLALTGTALGLLLLVLGLGLRWLVVRPTRVLRAATRRIADGDLETDLPEPSGTELGDLARDFAAMVGELKTSRGELQHLNSNLETEVARKTTELQSSNRKLATAERLAALGTLAGGIAHEFHNAIGGIRGCTDELLADEPDAERQETMRVILRAADRASAIVQQLLRFARQPVDRRADVDPTAVVEDALRLCEPAARRQRVSIDRSLAPVGTLRGDADGLHQVVVNLLLNALQAMPDGGTLRVATSTHADEIAIRVADDGVGIAPEALDHVFEPFFTARGSDPARAGTGLGLSVSHGIAAAHGGRITVESRPGEGATFTVLLPRDGTADDAAVTPAGSPVADR
ncbi:MAG: HAMP domain-containing protein [Planctomycetes bacterium]|nr:HAMP domain-containing protein [Planctomycetota bacterium]